MLAYIPYMDPMGKFIKAPNVIIKWHLSTGVSLAQPGTAPRWNCNRSPGHRSSRSTRPKRLKRILKSILENLTESSVRNEFIDMVRREAFRKGKQHVRMCDNQVNYHSWVHSHIFTFRSETGDYVPNMWLAGAALVEFQVTRARAGSGSHEGFRGSQTILRSLAGSPKRTPGEGWRIIDIWSTDLYIYVLMSTVHIYIYCIYHNYICILYVMTYHTCTFICVYICMRFEVILVVNLATCESISVEAHADG